MRYLYVMKSRRFPFRRKVGISNRPELRADFIEESIGSDVKVVTCVPMFWARMFEGVVLGIFSICFLRTRTRGSGRTEWVWSAFGLFPVMAVWLAFAIEKLLVTAVLGGVVFYFSTGKIPFYGQSSFIL